MSFNIRKASGEMQAFSEEKLRSSLLRSGASNVIVDAVIQQLYPKMYDGISSREIYMEAHRLLHGKLHSLAARFSLKNAIMELGPTGFPFERLVGEILKSKGYQVQTGVFFQGKCVQHEVDVVASNAKETIMVECKYHNTPGNISSVHIPLYVHSRFMDIEETWKKMPGNENKYFHGWVVTNTRFSDDAREYGACAGMRLVGWDYPFHHNLKEMIQTAGLYPLTVLTGISRKQKQDLVKRGYLLCTELLAHPEVLDEFGLPAKKMNELKAELDDLILLSKK